MIIKSLELSDFRNYESLSVEFDEGVNILYGENAQGKTNILEAVFLSCTTKSHRGSKVKEMIRFNKNEAHIRTLIEKDHSPYRVDMHIKSPGSKGIAIDGIKIRKASEFIGKLNVNVIFFSPEDLGIIKNSPQLRRNFMDMELCQMDKNYLSFLSRYKKGLLQRSKLLEQAKDGLDVSGLLDVFDEELKKDAKEIIRTRKDFVNKIAPLCALTHEKITGGREEMELSYEPSADIDDYDEKFSMSRTRDIRRLQTSVGPHRDDLKFVIKTDSFGKNKIDARKYGSQGQVRTAALSLKLSEIQFVKKITSKDPVLLLDDVLSELDALRQNFLLSAIGDTQTIITCTGLDEFVNSSLEVDRLFEVKKGNVSVKERQ